MTSKSGLSHRLELCELIKQLDNDECVNVIRSVHKEFGYSSLNTLLIKMIMHLSDTVTEDCLVKMKNTINDMISTQNTHIQNSNEKQKQKRNKKHKNSKLHRLPIDLMRRISIYLDEKDIFNFEQCCKLFYHISNNLSYINQSNTFKTFNLTTKRLYQMTQKQYNFYKYSKATTLIVESGKDYLVESQLEKAKIVAGYDKWLTSMFKSIKTLKVETGGTVLLPKLPIDILFDPDQSKSNLETFSMYVNDSHGEANIDKFYEKYIILKKKFANQGKKIRVLKCSRHWTDNLSTNVWSKLFFVESKHVCVNAHESHLKHLFENNFQLCSGDNNSSLEILTFNGCWFGHIDTSKINSNIHINSSGQMQIKTLRLIDLDAYSNTDIFENTKLIESLNFHNSVKNLTLNCTFDETDDFKVWTKVISNLLTKKHYFNLDNVNILLQFYGMYPKKDMVNWIFEILKENREILKHQFKQLNIGLDIIDSFVNERYYVLKWDCTIGEKFLVDYQQECNTISKQFEPSTRGESNPYEEKYNLVLKQWLD